MDKSLFKDVITRKLSNVALQQTFTSSELSIPFLTVGIRSNLANNEILCVVVADEEQAKFYCQEIKELSSFPTFEFPSWQIMPAELISPQLKIMGMRLKALEAVYKNLSNLILIIPLKSFVQLISTNITQKRAFEIQKGNFLSIEEISNWLYVNGYERVTQVENHAEFAIKGSIIDIYSPTESFAYRIGTSYDTVETIKIFNPDDQLSFTESEVVTIYPAREVGLYNSFEIAKLKRLELFKNYLSKLDSNTFFEGMESLLPWVQDEAFFLTNLFQPNTHLLIVDENQIRLKSSHIQKMQKNFAKVLSFSPRSYKRLYYSYDEVISTSNYERYKINPSGFDEIFRATPIDVRDNFEKRIKELVDQNYLIILSANNQETIENYKHSFASLGIRELNHNSEFGIYYTYSNLEKGAILQLPKLAIITEYDLGKKQKAQRPIITPKVKNNLFEEITHNSYIVHKNYGIGIYKGVTKVSQDNYEKEYLLIEYKDGDKLYVPFEQISMLTPYRGASKPILTKLGSHQWQATTRQVRREIAALALDLIELYSKREQQRGYSFNVNTIWLQELADSFIYQETPDQKKAIEETLKDMASSKPMDRLICGDVGFGKTEVAIRAAFVAVLNNKQVLVLCPTTVLARQHYEVFSERLGPFGVNVEMLSSLSSLKHTKEIINGLQNNKIDILIATHKAFSKHVKFNDLGLLVIDEEQRFGVNHKEHFKKIKPDLDVLTLSANPIPRTLEMALTGIRDFSLIKTPPLKRRSILTYVGPFDETLVIRAIKKEMLRNGQCFYIHNRIQDIEIAAKRLKKLIPSARVAYVHAEMDKKLLEKTVDEFYRAQLDVLVSTTIIESGIDIPNANTLIVDDAHLLGLGQLHQLRGRVGRSQEQAYAYFFYPENFPIPETSYKRLKTISEENELGSGFRLALRDLEMRGAGTLLGKIQSGHITKVGYDLYLEFVNQAIEAFKGNPVKQEKDIKLLIDASAHLPNEYVDDETTRIEFYRKLSSATTLDGIDNVANELLDRFGRLPKEAENLIKLAKLKLVALQADLTEIKIVDKITSTGEVDHREKQAKLSPIRLNASQIKYFRSKLRNFTYKDNAMRFSLVSHDHLAELLSILSSIKL